MASSGYTPPRVSRETRLLLITILLSLVSLLVLARLRFPDRPATPNPVPLVFSQLGPDSDFDELAASVSELGPRLSSTLIPVERPVHARTDTAPALRFRDDLAVALLGGESGPQPAETPAGLAVVARDPASGIAVLRVPATLAAGWKPWSPGRLSNPRYLVAADVSREGTSVRPVFIGSLHEIASPIWFGPVWRIPAHADLASGTFVFALDGALAGLVAEVDGGPAIVPSGTLMAMADRVLREGDREPGWLGVTVQRLGESLALATGSTNGVIVTWVDAKGPAAGQLVVTDVVEALDGEPILTAEHWQARIARLAAGESVVLRVRGPDDDDARHVTIAAAIRQLSPEELPLGLTLRTIPRTGAEVLRVQAGSAAARAGIEVGDVITVIGDSRLPTALRVSRAFANAPADRPVVVALTRGGSHHVVALTKR